MNRSEAGKLGGIKAAEIAKLKQIQRVEKYNKNPSLCKECNLPVPYEKKGCNKFCCRSCSATNSNKTRGLRISTRHSSKNEQYFCRNCENQIQITKHKKIYCTPKCQQDFQRKKSINEGSASARSIKTFLIKKYGPFCMDCGWSKQNPSTKTIPIELEHIDGNSENNLLTNLKLLCPNCHSLTPTYKGANMGKGRFKRRIRYQEGKSY